MHQFTIKDIEHFTGIKAHTLRIWEQRYRLFTPKRKATNHRIYDNDDLKVLLRIAYLYHHGVKISRIASLSEAEQKRLSLELAGKSGTKDIHVRDLITATLDYDQERFEHTFQLAQQQCGFERCITDVIYPFLERTGVLWLTGHVAPAQEHFSSFIIRKKIMVAIDGLPLNYRSSSHYLLFLPEGEYHEIPLLYVQYLLKKYQLMVTNFGANTQLRHLVDFTLTRGITHIYTYISHYTRLPARELMLRLSAYFPTVRILLSGPPVLHLQPPLPANVQLVDNLPYVQHLLKTDAEKQEGV